MSDVRDSGHAEIPRRLRAVLGKVLDEVPEIPEIPEDVPFTDCLGGRYDSLMALEFISAVEEEFGIEVDFVAHDVRYWFSEFRLVARFVADQLEDQAVMGQGPLRGQHG